MSSLSKHLLNNPEALVLDSLTGAAALNPAVSLDRKHRVLYQQDIAPNTVSLICGGGSGHEPAHAGFVGKGMLSAAVAGAVFASPNVHQIRRAIDLVWNPNGNGKGVLIIVKNYTGDVLNFGLAAEQTRASLSKEEGEKIRLLVVGDDVAVGRTQGSLVGRRGLAGTVLVYKIAGALAQQGGSLDGVETLARYIAENIATYGVGLEHCQVPGAEASHSCLDPDELELGMGIHNEPGFTHLKPYPPLLALIEQILGSITSTIQQDPERGFLENLKHDGKDEIVLLVNNLGSISQLEMGGIIKEAAHYLNRRGFFIRRALSGTYMTSLNMPGFSLTVMVLPRQGTFQISAEKIIELLDAATDAPGWPWHARAEPALDHPHIRESAATQDQHRRNLPLLKPLNSDSFMGRIRRVAKALIVAEAEITRQDMIAGDGDAGQTLRSGAQGVLKAIDTGLLNGQNVIADILVIADVVEATMGGTSGALYSIFFSGLASSLRTQADYGRTDATPEVWSKAVQDAQSVLYKYTHARRPSRTLVDPLAAFSEALSSNPSNFSNAVDAGHLAAEATRNQQATAGRSAYLDRVTLEEQNVPDPGAWGVWVILNALRGK